MGPAVIDTNILFHMWILDPILTLADEKMFEPLWSGFASKTALSKIQTPRTMTRKYSERNPSG